MDCALDSGSSGPGSRPGRGGCVVFLGKTLYSHSASLHPGVQMGTSKYAGGNPAIHPGRSSNTPSRFMLRETGIKRRPHGPLGPV